MFSSFPYSDFLSYREQKRPKRNSYTYTCTLYINIHEYEYVLEVYDCICTATATRGVFRHYFRSLPYSINSISENTVKESEKGFYIFSNIF